MGKKITRIVTHPAGMTLIMTVAIVLGGIFAYTFQILMMRGLVNHEFLEFQRYISFSNILGTLSSGLVLYMINRALTTHHDLSLQKSFRKSLFQMLQKYSLVIVFISGTIVIVTSFLFGLQSFLYLLVIRGGLVTGVIGASILGGLRGMCRFMPILSIQILGPLFKLLLGIIFLHLGFQGFGAFLASNLSAIVPLVIIIIAIYYRYHTITTHEKFPLHIHIGPFLQNSAIVILLGFLLNIDVMFVSKVVDTYLGSIYAGVSLLAKSMAFFLSAGEIVLLAKISEQVDRRHLRYPFWSMVSIALVAIIGVFFFGDTILYFMKAELGGYAWLLAYLVGLMTLFGIVSFYSQYLILQGNRSNLYSMGILLLLWYICIQGGFLHTLTDYIVSLLLLFFGIMCITLGHILIFCIQVRVRNSSKVIL